MKLFFPIAGVMAILYLVTSYVLHAPWYWVFLCVWSVPVLLALKASDVMINPPWHIYEKDHLKGLPRDIVGRGAKLMGEKINDPKTDFDIHYEDIEIEAVCKVETHRDAHVLRGWHIPSIYADSTTTNSEKRGSSKQKKSSSSSSKKRGKSSSKKKKNSVKSRATRGRSNADSKISQLSSSELQEKRRNTCIVFVHGGARDRRAFMRHLPVFHKRGFGAICFDCREHGVSDNQSLGIGWTTREAHDVEEVTRYAREELGYTHTLLIGTSQGAASALVAAGFDKQVELVVAENPYASREVLMSEILNDTLGRAYFLNPFKWLLIKLVVTMSLWRLKVNSKHHPNAIDVIETLAPRPVFILHGTKDDIVHHRHSIKLYERAAQPKKLWIAPDAEHTALYDLYPEEWEERVIGFFEEHGW